MMEEAIDLFVVQDRIRVLRGVLGPGASEDGRRALLLILDYCGVFKPAPVTAEPHELARITGHHDIGQWLIQMVCTSDAEAFELTQQYETSRRERAPEMAERAVMEG